MLNRYLNQMCVRKILSCVTLTLLACSATTTAMAESHLSVVLPINAVQEPKIALALTVPEDFKALPNQQTIPQFAMAEFIPSNETGDAWTQIITTNSFIDKRLSAATFIQYMQQRFRQDATDVRIIDTVAEVYKDYQKACTTMDYHIAARHEMVAMCYYSGPYDTAGVQYAVLYPADNPPAADVAKKLENFINTQVQVLNEEQPTGTVTPAAIVTPVSPAAPATTTVPATTTIAPATTATPVPAPTTVVTPANTTVVAPAPANKVAPATTPAQ